MKNILFKMSKAFFYLFLGMMFIRCQNNRDEIMAIGKKTVMPSLVGYGLTMLYSDSSILKMKLETPEIQKFEKDIKEPVTIMPRGLFVTFYDNKGLQTSTLKGDYGVKYEYSQRMEAKRNVEVVNIKGEKLNTSHLFWDGNKKKIVSDTFVKITTATEIITGFGLESNDDFTQYEIKEMSGSTTIEN